MSRTTVVSALGDSITAGTPLWDPNPNVRETIGPALDERSQWPYWVALKEAGLSIRNHGVNLERTDQIRARLDEAAAGADALVIQGGINDIVQQRATADTLADILEMALEAKRRGIRVAVADVLPWNNGYPEHHPAIQALNKGIAAIAADQSIAVLPFYGTLEDPDRPGRMRPDWTADGNHPTVEGHRQLADAFPLEWLRNTSV